jgi:hypothetical protein
MTVTVAQIGASPQPLLTVASGQSRAADAGGLPPTQPERG